MKTSYGTPLEEVQKRPVEIIPAIDLRDGRCVRLYQGDYSRETVFSGDPAAVALEWQSMGALKLHIVDLDGAARGHIVNRSAIGSIIGAIDIPVEIGGGVRDLADVTSLFNMGAERVVIGTAAVDHPEMVKEAASIHKDAIVVGVDARNGMVAVRGWKETTSVHATQLIHQMAGLGVQRFNYTDISRDGTMTEPNFDAIEALVDSATGSIIAAGGISKLAHIKRLREIGVEGVIIGLALYQGAFSLNDAILAAK